MSELSGSEMSTCAYRPFTGTVFLWAEGVKLSHGVSGYFAALMLVTIRHGTCGHIKKKKRIVDV